MGNSRIGSFLCVAVTNKMIKMDFKRILADFENGSNFSYKPKQM